MIKQESMKLEELARWLCLIEGINIVFDKVEEKKEDDDFAFMKDRSIFSAMHKGLSNYIEERTPAMIHDLKCYVESGDDEASDYFSSILRN